VSCGREGVRQELFKLVMHVGGGATASDCGKRERRIDYERLQVSRGGLGEIGEKLLVASRLAGMVGALLGGELRGGACGAMMSLHNTCAGILPSAPRRYMHDINMHVWHVTHEPHFMTVLLGKLKQHYFMMPAIYPSPCHINIHLIHLVI
jgi:hypothetical protein